ncbi:unnamed protein product, partial [Mesorhabditis belari]|uniref:Peptidase metallopeptidase domain-containing protein n=1 Tax=Mesorhabditis belari TaxID=2138241 RepID=A0AAF3EVZ0_9BILA
MFYHLFTIGYLIANVKSFPVSASTPIDRFAKDFLFQFGYYENHLGYGEDVKNNEEMTRKAIRRFQKNFNLPLTGLLDEITRKEMKKPRCGVKEILRNPIMNNKLRYFVMNSRPLDLERERRFEDKNLTYSIEKFSENVTKEEIRAAARLAFDKWEEVTPLQFHEVPSNGKLKPSFEIGVHRRPGYLCDPFDADGMLSFVARLCPYPEKLGLVHFNDEKQWTFRNQRQIVSGFLDLIAIAVHEIGHAIGLDHLPNPDAIMYQLYDTEIRRNKKYVEPKLHQDDIDAAQKVHGSKTITTTADAATAATVVTKIATPSTRAETTKAPMNRSDRKTLSLSRKLSSTSCPTKIDNFFAVADQEFIVDGAHLFQLDHWRIEKVLPIYKVFPKIPQNIDAIVFEPINRKVIFFARTENGSYAYIYFFSLFSNEYLREYVRLVRGYPTNVTGAIQTPNGKILLVDQNSNLFKLDVITFNVTVYQGKDFRSFPRNVRGAFQLTDEIYLLMKPREFIVYNRVTTDAEGNSTIELMC